MMNYHAHFYFRPEEKSKAVKIFDAAQKNPRFHYSKMFLLPIGPHPLGMVELQFKVRDLREVVCWIEKVRGGLSVLVHEDSGDDFRDHTLGASWYGKSLDLNFGFFEAVIKDPKMKIHNK